VGAAPRDRTMSDTGRPPIHWTRIALLGTTVLMAVALLGTSVAAWRSAREASDEIVQAQAFDLKRALWREMRRADGDRDAALADAVLSLDDQGLRYAALVDREGAVVASAGEPLVPEEELAIGFEEIPHREPVDLGERIRMVEPFRETRGRGMRSSRRTRGVERERGEGRDRVDGAWDREGPRESDSLRHDKPRHGAYLVVLEFEPVLARSLTTRATTTLITGAGAAAVLLLVAVVVWRMGARADQAALQLARDRHLATLGEMSAVLGHEIRNPLASLKGHAQLLVEKLPDDDAARPKAERVVREAVRLEELTGHILDFARTGQLTREPVDPEALARAAAEQVDPERVVVEAGEGLAPWPLDRERMEQVLTNVIRNGVQASPDDAPVTVRVAREEGHLVFEVRDRGEGIPEGEEHRIFEPFYTQRVRGTGLGLALARRIVEDHGGTIEAGNHPDGGARIRIELTEEA